MNITFTQTPQPKSIKFPALFKKTFNNGETIVLFVTCASVAIVIYHSSSAGWQKGEVIVGPLILDETFEQIHGTVTFEF